MTDSVYITGLSCLSPYGLSISKLAASLLEFPELTGTEAVGKSGRKLGYFALADFSPALSHFVPPLKRRKMSRLSRMAVTSAGLALRHAGLEGKQSDCGVVLGTAFGSTSQSELFYQNMCEHGFVKANPGLFPETVPNSPAGQVSITFGLQGANTTICQQSLSSELALMTGMDLIQDGKLDQVVVIGLEEMSAGLLAGLWGCGVLQKTSSVASIPMGRKMLVGEGAVAFILESADSVARRGGEPLAELVSVYSAGASRWPAAYTGIEDAVKQVANLTGTADADCVIPSGSFITEVDHRHFHSLATLFPEGTAMLIPEYHTGALFGAGLLKQAVGIYLLNQADFYGRPLGPILDPSYANLYPQSFEPVSSVFTSALSAGGGCGGTLLRRVN
jgi:3-oxoacyl-[acyl-carrier-protein] synthase II